MRAYEAVLASRNTHRPTAVTYIDRLIDGFIEMHGDRRFADDPAIIAGVGYLDGMPVTVIGIEKGSNTNEKIYRNFGQAHPEGYRKALRQIKLAEKFHRPVLCLVDTAGAYCGVGAEERGQGLAIAENMYELMTVRTPVLSIVIGEGGSGGALALAVADEVWMLEDAYYSVISPEGAASILWKDSTQAERAAECLKLTAPDLQRLGIIERVIPGSDLAGTHMDGLRAAISAKFREKKAKDMYELLEERYQRYRQIGEEIQ